MTDRGTGMKAGEDWRQKLLGALNRFSASIPAEELFPTVSREATAFSMKNPYAFAIATCLDRGAKADIVWTFPFEMDRLMRGLDPYKVEAMSVEDVGRLLARLPRKPRFMNAAPRTIKELTRIVVEELDGDAAAIWRGKSAAEVKTAFLRIYGVGEGIANIAVLLIEAAYGVRFSDLDRRTMDIKPDTHTCRVLYRLGVAEDTSTDAALQGARWLSPEYPGEVDGPLWTIGRRWCRPSSPNCPMCPVGTLCKKVGLA
jgi:endonuclease III